MNSRLTLAEVLGSVSATYKSIDLRTVTANLSGKWYNLVTVLRFSDTDVDQCFRDLQQKLASHLTVDCDELKIVSSCVSMAEFDTVIRSFEGGNLQFYEYPIMLGRSVNLNRMMGYVNRYGSFVESCEWPSFEGNEVWTPDPTDQNLTATLRELKYFVQSQSVLRRIDIRGYRLFTEVLQAFLNSRQGAEPSYCSDVYISAPVFARISSGLIEPITKKLTVTFVTHPELANSLMIHGTDRDSNNRSERFGLTIQAGASGWERRAEGNYRTGDQEGQIGARIVHEKLGEIYPEGWRIRDLVPRHKLNPLWYVLRKFCSPTELASLLSEPTSLPGDQNKPQRLFEKHVAWLLACYGFASVVLGSHEHLHQGDPKVSRGSLDIVAFHSARQILLLASCTMNPPKEEDYSNLLNLRALLLGDIENDVPFSTSMAIFTVAAACSSSSEQIGIFDAPSMQAAIQALEEGNEGMFFQQLSPLPVLFSNF